MTDLHIVAVLPINQKYSIEYEQAHSARCMVADQSRASSYPFLNLTAYTICTTHVRRNACPAPAGSVLTSSRASHDYNVAFCGNAWSMQRF